MIYITAVRMSPPTANDHQHIESLKWENPADQKTGVSSRADIVKWIRDDKGDARVRAGGSSVKVGVVDGTPPYLRTYADGSYTNNLLSLPRF